MPRVQSITRKSGLAKKWALLAGAALLAELGVLALNAGLTLPGEARALALLDLIPAQANPLGATARPKSAVLGQLVAIRGPLKFRDPASPVWEEPPTSGLIRAGYSLRTLEHGSASIALFDGSLLTLEENSRIELDSNASAGLALKLISGRVYRRLAPTRSPSMITVPRRAGYSPTIEISEPEAGIAVPPMAEFSLHRSLEEEDARRLDLRALRGEIGLRTATGNFLLQPGEEALQMARGGFEFRKMPFVLLSPPAAQAIDGGRARFEWSVDPGLTGGSPLELQLSFDPGFERIAKAIRIAATEPPLRHVETEVALPAGDGPCYWRVRVVTDPTVVSDAAFFWPASAAASSMTARPRLRLPLESAVAIAGKPLSLVWAAVPGASAYEVDIAGRDQPIVTREADISLDIDDLTPGRRSWRVRARLANAGLSPWSDSRALTVVSPPPASSDP